MAEEIPRCPCCHLQQRPLYCAACLREGIALHNEALKSIQGQIDLIVKRSAFSLGNSTKGINAWRTLCAEVAERARRCEELKKSITQRQMKIVQVISRRAALQRLRTSPSPKATIENAIKRCQLQQQTTAYHIVNARRVLVQEAVNVFGLRRNSNEEWTIAGLVLPNPDTFRLHPSSHINAALLHTIHLLSLITSYLSITLPFTPTFPPPFESKHIGRPSIKPNLPFVGTTKWRDKNVLWMSSTASVASKIKNRNSLSASKVFAQPNISAIVVKSMNKHRQFLTSFALLAFSIAYLGWSQGVEGIGIRDGQEYDSDEDDPTSADNDPVSISATSILELIAALAISPKLGHKTHEPGTKDVIRHLGFGLDVAKVVQSVLNAEENRSGTKAADGSGEDLSEGWDLLDNEGS